MPKREMWLFIAAVGIEVIAVGIGFVVSPQYGWGIATVGLGVFIFALWRAYKAKDKKKLQPTLTEISKWVKQRKQYLPQLKQAFGDYINRVEILAKTDNRLYDLEQYKRFYPISRLFIFLSRGDGKGSLLEQLRRKNIWIDNIVLRQVENEDAILREVSVRMNNLATNIRDKTVKNYAIGMKKAAHIAYSYVVYCDLITKHYEEVPFSLKFHFNQMQKMIDRFRQHQNNINIRINELLEGAEDEL